MLCSIVKGVQGGVVRQPYDAVPLVLLLRVRCDTRRRLARLDVYRTRYIFLGLLCFCFPKSGEGTSGCFLCLQSRARSALAPLLIGRSGSAPCLLFFIGCSAAIMKLYIARYRPAMVRIGCEGRPGVADAWRTVLAQTTGDAGVHTQLLESVREVLATFVYL